MKDRQEELSRIQLLKTHYVAENHKQDSRNNDNNLILYHD